jgi:hypothetical protein
VQAQAQATVGLLRLPRVRARVPDPAEQAQALVERAQAQVPAVLLLWCPAVVQAQDPVAQVPQFPVRARVPVPVERARAPAASASGPRRLR